MIILVFVGHLFLFSAEVLLWEAKDPKKVVVFGALMSISLVFASLLSMGVEIPSVAPLIESLVVGVKTKLGG